MDVVNSTLDGYLVVAKRGEGAWNPYPPVAVMDCGLAGRNARPA
jgi:hypothetical protein